MSRRSRLYGDHLSHTIMYDKTVKSLVGIESGEFQ